jgi:MoxR-like ATPase
MFMIYVDYPSAEEELEIMRRGTSGKVPVARQVLGKDHIQYLQGTVRRMPVADHVLEYAQKIAAATRAKSPQVLDLCKKWLAWGAGPRASLNLILAAKAHAILRGEVYVSCDDVAEVAPSILRHRLIPNFTAQSEGITSDDITRMILGQIPKDE